MSLRNYLPVDDVVRKSLVSLAAVVMAAIVFSVAIPAARSAAGPDTTHDATMKAFLQKRFRIPSGEDIKLGPPRPSPIQGLWSRTMTVSNGHGASQSVTLFTDASGQKVIMGQLIDITKDPWGRVDLKGIHLDDRASAGPSDAPVTVVEFGDFECPFCARALNILETLVNTTYKGRVHLIFKNFPLAGHLWAMEAATAAECVRLQNPQAFWDFARDLYRDQPQINPKNIREHINSYASSLQLDTTGLSACMMGRAASDRIKQDVEDGTRLKVSSTPTFYINGIPVVGFPDERALTFVIDSELQREKTASARQPNP